MNAPYWRQNRDGRGGAGRRARAGHQTDTGSVPSQTDVVVIGAGIAGLTVATELAGRGHRVTVLDMGVPGSGTTGASSAKVTALHGASISKVAEHHGANGARAYVEGNQLGVEQIRSLVEQLDTDVGWLPTWASTYTTEPGRVGELDREHDAALAAGLPIERRQGLDLPVGAIDALVLEDQGAVDPVRLIGALAATLRRDGHRVIEGCRALAVDHDPTPVVHTDCGSIRAEHVVVTTLLPFVDPLALFSRVTPMMSYSLAVRLAEPVADGLHLSIDEPSRSVRPIADDPHVAIVGGGSHRVGEGGDTRLFQQQLRSWADEHLRVVEVIAEWSAHDLVPSDAVPFIGRTGNDDALLVATGFRKWGFSNAGAASVLIADILDGDPPDWGQLFDPRRPFTTSLRSAYEVVKGNLGVARHFVGDKLATLSPPSVDTLAPGQGGIVRIDGTKVAAHRTSDGRLEVRSATCPHLGCQVVWNPAATTWDCPCHGSRFTPGGDVVAGPATEPLDAINGAVQGDRR